MVNFSNSYADWNDRNPNVDIPGSFTQKELGYPSSNKRAAL
jgi:hypothetical protein